MKNSLKSILILLAFGSFSMVKAQSSPATLTVGSPAPELKVSWLKGTPVKSFDNKMLYVVEFWATWCGPCKAAMPHLSELAKRYESKVIFIGVDVWEKGNKDKPYDSFTPMLKEFVEGMGDKMAYNIAMDNNDLYMVKNWMDAAGQNGIPCSFIIKEGKVIWIGHPHVIENTIDEILAGKYDMATYAKSYEENLRKSKAQTEPLIKLSKVVNEAVKVKDYTKALNEIEAALPTIDPMFKISVMSMKFSILLKYKPVEALNYGKEWVKENANAKSSVALSILQEDGLPKDAYLLAVDYLKEMLPNANKYAVYDYIAQGYAKAADFVNAAAAEKLAIEQVKILLNSSDSQGLTQGKVKEMEEQLAKYEAKLK